MKLGTFDYVGGVLSPKMPSIIKIRPPGVAPHVRDLQDLRLSS